MSWVCLVCGKPAVEVVTCATTKEDKKGRFKAMSRGFCEKHKHQVEIIGGS